MKTINIINYLNELYPNPTCELIYNKDYELLIAIMLSAQTKDKAVNNVTKILFNKYKTIEELNNSNIEDLNSILKPIGNQNKKSIYIKEISKYITKNGIPNNLEELEKIKGIGRKTATLFLGIIYNKQYIPIDTHIKRISKRLKLVNENDNIKTIETKLTNYFKNENLIKIHLQLVLFGRYKCKAKNPDCINCKLKKICKKETI